MNARLRANALGRAALPRNLRSGLGFVRSWVRDRAYRRAFWLCVARPTNLFQPYGDTSPDRYPELFAFARSQVGDGPEVRLLSFGCSRGDEVASLRHYFSTATIKGIDISRGNVRECRRRRDLTNDPRITFARAGDARAEPLSHYDAIFCMAVFRHGGLTGRANKSCADLINFEAFERTVSELSQCLKPGGLLVIEHSNFRFSDSVTSRAFDCIKSRARAGQEQDATPLFGPDNSALPPPEEIGTVFRKYSSEHRSPSGETFNWTPQRDL